MDSVFDLNIWRGVERLAIVTIGGLSIYFGYRLFTLLPPSTSKSEARLFLPGDISVYLGRIAPGIFFAFFGAVVIAISLIQPAILEVSTREGDNISLKTTYLGGASNQTRYSQTKNQVLNYVSILTNLQQELKTVDKTKSFELDQSQIRMLTSLIPELKKRLVLSVWNEEMWGKRDSRPLADFLAWTNSGAPFPVPHEFQLPTEIVEAYRVEDKK